MEPNIKFFIRHVFSRIREISKFHPNAELRIAGFYRVVDFMYKRDVNELNRVLNDNKKFFTLCFETGKIIPNDIRNSTVSLTVTAFTSRCVSNVGDMYCEVLMK